MQNLELVLEENVENTHLDGLCVLYSTPCAPLMFEPLPSLGPMGLGPVSSEVSAYLGDMSNQHGVRSTPATAEYQPAVSQEIVNYAGSLGERVGITSGSITPITPVNDALTNYAGVMMEQMGVYSTPQSPGVMGFELQVTPQIMDYANNLGNQYGAGSAPKPVELSVRSTSFEPLPIMDVMNGPFPKTGISESTLSYLGNLGNQMGVQSSPVVTPIIKPMDYKPAFEMPKFEPIMQRNDFIEKPLLNNMLQFKEPSFIPKTEQIMPKFEMPKYELPKFDIPKLEPVMPRTDFMEKPLFDNLLHSKQSHSFDMPKYEPHKFEMPRLEPIMPKFEIPEFDMLRFEPPKIELTFPKVEPLIKNDYVNLLKKGIEFDGGLTLHGTKNTAIIKEPLGEGFTNIYSFHDKGTGRIQLDLKLPGRRGSKILAYPKDEW